MKTLNKKGTTKYIITVLLLLVVSCHHSEPIREPQTTPPELMDSVLNWERIINKEPNLMYCFSDTQPTKHNNNEVKVIENQINKEFKINEVKGIVKLNN